jgi:hypothetical protein
MSLRLKLIQGAWLVCSATQIFGQSQLAEHRVFIPERGEVVAYLVSVHTNHYSFLPPPVWRASCKPGANSIVIIADDLRTSITVDFINKADGDEPIAPKDATAAILERQSPTNNPAYVRASELLSARYPEGRIRDAFVALTGAGAGVGFDLERKAASNTKLVSRVVYAAQDWGFVEFVLTAPPAKFAETTIIFANLINSFQRPAR